MHEPANRMSSGGATEHEAYAKAAGDIIVHQLNERCHDRARYWLRRAAWSYSAHLFGEAIEIWWLWFAPDCPSLLILTHQASTIHMHGTCGRRTPPCWVGWMCPANYLVKTFRRQTLSYALVLLGQLGSSCIALSM
jgi:hypothetical protein